MRHFFVLIALCILPSLSMASTPERMLDTAESVFSSFVHHPERRADMQDLLRRSRGLIIVTSYNRAGFIIGGAFGRGLLLAKNEDGSWTNPAFVEVGGGGLGLQAGISTAEMLVFIMTNKGLEAVINDQVRLGVMGGVSVLTLGREMSAARALRTGSDVITIAQTAGLYGGIALEGSAISADGNRNRAFYGQNVSMHDIIINNSVNSPQTERLREMIARESR